ncbi:MAG: ComEC/Rec2 family competence protein [Candidatus Paceibacterota bacterium]
MVIAQIFLYGCLAVLAGVGAASLIEISIFLFWFGAALAAFLFAWGLLAKKQSIAVSGIMLAGFILGFSRFDAVWRHSQDNQLTVINGTTVQISGRIANDPVLAESSQQIVLRPNGLGGKILVIAPRYPEYHYGDQIEFAALLETPQSFSGFDYRNYLAKDGIYSMARYPKIEFVSGGNGNLIYGSLLWMKQKLKEGISRSLPSPHDSLLIAILLGDQSGLSGCPSFAKASEGKSANIEAETNCMKLKEKLNIAGLRHLAAVSGTHITIMAGIIAPFLLWLGWWRQKALAAALVFIWAFIAMIGMPASAVRAGIMGGLMIIAQIVGRPGDILRLVAIAATFMVWINPMILRFDIGFQLSFLAVLGMAVFAQPIEAKLNFIPKKPEFIRQALAIALAAQIFTLPILVYNFGYVSAYGLVANVLAEPVVPFITIYGFILAIAAAFSFVLGGLLFFPMWLALSYLLITTNIFSQLPGSKLNFGISFFWLAISYVILAIIAWRIKEKEKLDFLDPHL